MRHKTGGWPPIATYLYTWSGQPKIQIADSYRGIGDRFGYRCNFGLTIAPNRMTAEF